MFRIILRDILILLATVVLVVFSVPIWARQIDEKSNQFDDYIRVISALPDNREIAATENLPENEDKTKIKKIIIDLSEQKMYLFENNKQIKETLVSTGKAGMWTPIGEYQVHDKNLRAWSKMAGLWMPYWMLIEPNKGIGIHELPEWPGGYKEGANHLGQPVSHGCIRLGVGAAEEVYNWVEIGTEVEIVE